MKIERHSDSLLNRTKGEGLQKGAEDRSAITINRLAVHHEASSMNLLPLLTPGNGFASKPAGESLKGVSFFSSSQKKSALKSAQERWKIDTPFLLAVTPPKSGSKILFLSDGQKTQKEYLKWGEEAYFLGREELPKPFSDPTVFFVSHSSKEGIIRLGTVSDMEKLGIGYRRVVDLISIDTAEEESQGYTDEKKVLLHLLSAEKIIHQESDYKDNYFLQGLWPSEVEDAAQNLLFSAAAAPFDEDRTPLVRMLLRFGADPKKCVPWEDHSPWDIAIVRKNTAVQDVMASFLKQR